MALKSYHETALWLARWLKQNAQGVWLKNHRLAEALKAKLNVDATEIDIREMVNYIRSNSLAPLVASSQGYRYETDPDKLAKYIEHFRDRIGKMQAAERGLLELFVTAQSFADKMVATAAQNA